MKLSKVFATQDGRFRVHLSTKVINELLSLSIAAGIKETGGILVGHYDKDHTDAYVTDISGPGRGSKHGFVSFFRAVGHLQGWLDKVWNGGKSYYLGEWHFHPMSSPTASNTDKRQMFEITTDAKASCPEPILIILGGNPKAQWKVSVSIFTKSKDIYDLDEADRHLLSTEQ